MAAALGLARRGLGRVWPNPAVGCVIVAGDRVVGRGWTRPGGRPHAETVALAHAGAAARGATVYVTLEPCAHHGMTLPCADALVDADVRRVVVALGDPDPRVNGGGVARLRAAGIAVEVGLSEAEARAVNAGFLLHRTMGRPLVTLKVAASLDGRVATGAGASRWITGPAARERGHDLRLNHDAILVGIGTALADDPELTCRLPGLADRSPVRVVLDGAASLPANSRLARGARTTPVWLVCRAGVMAPALESLGVELVAIEAGVDGRLAPAAVLAALARRGITRLLVEGGPRVATSFLAAGLVDRVAWTIAPRVLGGDGRAAVADLGIDNIEQAPRLVLEAIETVDGDLLARLRAGE
ncbi:MAG: bifunctional diaminohydroxyphosphoribosylaminopyrimidine deaminase/5-amino-6-(5-phosphoribosylamino)uracil reductase RibD [Alphaproteobacteria bacterium]|nr:bifunctional diaminohydroxyphosphoribosylaminopyrimidine deaminase/5-amino-6-(5-phosphoribosylamino)uracil reductase RibD [Alphaproteobacteria bacterium]